MRVIPILLLHEDKLVKTKKFSKPQYVGDPINAVKIFNEKEVDELVLLDISASKNKKNPNFNLIENIVSEAFMPVAYGGGIKTFEEAKRLFALGIEKLVFNNLFFENPEIIAEIVKYFGSQSVVLCLNLRKNFWSKYELFVPATNKSLKFQIEALLEKIQLMGFGELIIQSVNNDGMREGMDYDLLKLFAEAVSIPVVLAGGASNETDFFKAKEAGASAVGAGSMFVFTGKHNAVLITYKNPFNL